MFSVHTQGAETSHRREAEAEEAVPRVRVRGSTQAKQLQSGCSTAPGLTWSEQSPAQGSILVLPGDPARRAQCPPG